MSVSKNLVDAPPDTLHILSVVSVTFNEPPASPSIEVKDPDGVPVVGTLATDTAGLTITFFPESPLRPATTYSVTITATDRAGVVMRPLNYSITTD